MIACFDHKILELAEGIAMTAFQQKKLTLTAYEDFHAWIEDRYLQMADDVVIKKDTKRTFYGFAHRAPGGKVRYYCNAFESEAYKRRNALMCQEQFCTPIISQTFYYDQMPNVAEERKKFLCQLEEWMDKEYWAIVDKICALPVVVDEAAFGTLREKADADALRDMIGYYASQWQIG